jgi:hypothetical protein
LSARAQSLARRLAALGAALGVVLAPAVAAACPYCTGLGEDTLSRGLVIGAMIATPFLAIGIALPLIVRFLRRADELDAEQARFTLPPAPGESPDERGPTTHV